MTPRPDRIVDAHVHLWDPARTEWYPYLGGDGNLGMGDISGMARRFDAATYHAEAGTWNVVKLVNVAAATDRHSVDETLELDRRADRDGEPAALVGGLPTTDSPAEAIALLDEQLQAARFRGVRPMGRDASPVPADEVLAALAERDLVFELLAHPPDLAAAARRFTDHPDLTVVVEHAGWPRAADDAERATWLAGIEALAAAGDHVHCKLSGLAMPLGIISAEAFAPWLEPAIEAFGPARCLFASNFPVDGLHGTLDQLWTAYHEATATMLPADRDRLFATTAERVYRC